ncbi:uncharacterized protein TNCV_1646961 [Trichonephila clavipes]|nr:uncharacterized protein TNCV_1646961 [Trichonephila clavipes]
MNPSTTDSVSYASFGILSYHSTSFATKWNVCKTSIALTVIRNHRRLRRQWCDGRLSGTTKRNDNVFTENSHFCMQHNDGRIQVLRHRGERLLNCCIMQRHTGPASGIMVWGCIEFHCHTLLVRIAGTLNSQRYIFEVLELVVFPYI